MVAPLFSRFLLGRLRRGRVELVDGDGTRAFGPADAPLSATVRVRDDRFLEALPRGSLALADTYADAAWDSDDLVTLVRIGAREIPRTDRFRRLLAPVRNAFSRIPRNTREGARRHIAAHYDLGNDMFRTFLDETMTYSCAYFESPEATLREAQEAKLDRICRKLELGPDDHVVEIGTGWGSFAMHAAGRYGCRVTTTTISREQHALAAERVRQAGLDDRIEIVLEDYRDLRGRYDKLVSIEMIEAVGWRDFGTFFARCGDLLHPDGAMLLQAITIDDRAYEVEKASRSFMRTHIFPNGCLPSLEVIARCVAHDSDLRTVDLEELTPHYAETVRRWRANVEREAPALAALGYDERFRRMWRMYLAYCEGGFAERRIGVVQAVLAKPGWRGSVRAGVTAAPPVYGAIAAAG
jgi:cyclopropane-fatty-acyl-phospholipid synthase